MKFMALRHLELPVWGTVCVPQLDNGRVSQQCCRKFKNYVDTIYDCPLQASTQLERRKCPKSYQDIENMITTWMQDSDSSN
jgi:hypothetical protein